MKIAIIIPAHNEELYIQYCLQSLCEQSYLPYQLIVVNDHSTDNTASIVEKFAKKHTFIQLVHHFSSHQHAPGSKVIDAFYHGFNYLHSDYDVICKFDADLIFPSNYLLQLKNAFSKNPRLGMYAGFCYIKKEGHWVIEQLTNKDHIRGALKAYKKRCFEDIGGLKKDMGWDTVDELLARYYGWQTQTNEHLVVKHLKPTGQNYAKTAAKRFGVALYKMDLKLVLSFLSILKLAYLKRNMAFFFEGISSYLHTAIIKKPKKMVNYKEGRFIRKYRWKMIIKKFGITR